MENTANGAGSRLTSSERFAAPIDYWGIADYERQWGSTIRSMIDGHPNGHLLSAMRDPHVAEFIAVYSLYREGNNIFVQN